jgi:hypothetical protein
MRRPVLVPADIKEMHSLSQSIISDFFKGKAMIQKRAGDLGRKLSQIILPPPVFTYLVRSLERVQFKDGLRLRLCLDTRLVDLPWEWTWRPDAIDEDSLSGFLALNPRISLVR